jgi:hypothetical protein
MDRPFHYILNDAGEPEPCDDTLRWAQWHQDNQQQCVVGQQHVFKDGRDVYISTVFLALDHAAFMMGPAVLWETIVFTGDVILEQHRYRSKAEAIEGHNAIVTRYGGFVLQ